MVRAPLALVAVIACVAAAPARAEVYRCTSGSGAVTYQEIPCRDGERLELLDVPANYPAPDTAERDRLFQREAALDRRLEARRERESRETIARLSQPVAQAAPQEPQFAWLFPPAIRAHPHRAGSPRPHPRFAPFLR